MEIIIGDAKPPPQSKTPNCFKCAYFKITCDLKYPKIPLRACDMFSIMCTNIPSIEVFRATGSQCPAFELKKGLK